MKKLVCLIGVIATMTALSGCQERHYVEVVKGVIGKSSYIYYDEDLSIGGYEWSGDDLIIHFERRAINECDINI